MSLRSSVGVPSGSRPLFVLPAAAAGCAVAGESGLSAMLPNLAGRSETATVNAMFQALLQVGQVAGPAVAGLLLAGVGVRFVYWLDAASVAVAMLATARMGRQRPAVRDIRRACARSWPGSVTCAGSRSFMAPS